MSSYSRIALLVCVLSLGVFSATPLLAAPGSNFAAVSADVFGSDGLPIGGASVEVNVLKNGAYRPLAELASGAEGDVDYAVKAGSYRIDVEAPSADPESVYLEAERAGAYELDITLQSYGSVSGTISDNYTGLPVAGATVSFYLQNPDGTWPSIPSFSVVATDGAYSTGTVAAGSYRVTATADGYAPGFYDGYGLGYPTVVVNRGSDVTGIGMALTPLAQSGTISGRVVSGATQSPRVGAYVFMYKRNTDGTWPATSPGWGSPTRTVYSAGDGTYVSGDLPLGEYKVRFFTAMTGSQWWQYVLTADAATVLTLDTPGQAITGVDGWFNKPL